MFVSEWIHIVSNFIFLKFPLIVLRVFVSIIVFKCSITSSGSFIIASDAISLERNIKHDEVPKNAWDGDLLLNSYQELRNLENKGFQLIYGHDYNQWEILKQTQQYYE